MELRLDLTHRDHCVELVRPSLPLPASIEPWMESTMIDSAPEGSTWKRTFGEVRQSQNGWPVSVFVFQFMRDGSIVESRLGVFFRLLYNGADVVIRSRDPQRFEAELPDMLREILAAEVRWPESSSATLHGLLGFGQRL